MTTLKLSYFDINGGRAEPIRLALHIGGIAFEDYRFGMEAFEQERLNTPLGQVPVLEVNGVNITQTNAILRYVGKQTQLYPTDLYQALICDEVLDAIEDTINKIVPTLFLSGAAQKEARESLVKNELPKYLKFLEDKLVQQGGEWLANSKLTIADLKISALIGWLNSGALDHIPDDLIAHVAPKLNQLQNKVTSDAGVVAYYASL